MQNFEFHNPTKILFGEGQIAKITAEIANYSKVLMVYGGGSIKSNGVYKQVITALDDVDFVEFTGIEPNPKYDTLMKAVSVAKEENVDFILAVGGGSVIDGCKFIAATLAFEGDEPWDILSKQAAVNDAFPVGAVLTLPATGSESNGNSVVTRGEDKFAFSSIHVFPAFSVLDPQVTFSLPEKQISNGVVDAYVHIMEQYLTQPMNAKVQDRFAEGLLLTLIEEGPKALLEPNNYDIRANVMWSATLALNTLIGKGVPQDWSTHMIGHELTGLFGMDHAQTLAIILPAVMKERTDVKRDKLIQYAERIWNLAGDNTDEQCVEQRIQQAIEKTESFFADMKLSTRLSQQDLNEESIKSVLSQLNAHQWVKLGEDGKVDLAMSERILNKAL